MKSPILIIIACFFVCFTNAQDSLGALLNTYNTRSVPYISVEEFRALQYSGKELIVLDTREKEEFDVSHIKGATLAGYNNFSIDSISKTITNKEAAIIVYCSLGIRSEVIGEKLNKAGYTNIRNLYGGIFEWKNKGYEVLDFNETETENVHTCTKSWGKWLYKGTKVH